MNRKIDSADVERLGPWTTRFRVGGEPFGGTFEVGEDEPLMREFLQRCPPLGRVLELGCMEGGRTFPLARRVGHVLAVDVRREHLQRARFAAEQLGVSNVTFLELDLESCDLETLGTFDAVYNVGLLYHLADPSRLLRQLAVVSPRMFLSTHVASGDDEDFVERCGYQGRLCCENPTQVVGGVRSQSFRPTRATLLKMLDDAGWRAVELVRDEKDTVAHFCRTSAAVPAGSPTRRALPRLAVIVTCHNYGRYLDECLRSVVAQTHRPADILVVDDASDDDTPDVAARWADWGVRYLRVEHRDPRPARLAGLESTESEFVCFLDADDRLCPDYLRTGLAGFERYDVGFVYSDSDCFGDRETLKAEPERIDAGEMSRANFVHNGALIRREALEMCRALEVTVDSRKAHEDWLVFRRLLEQGWKARWQRGVYGYRFHDANRSGSKLEGRCYFDLRALGQETITLFIALSGRWKLWPELRQFLEQQAWPHAQVRLVLTDTSQDERFGRHVRRWIVRCDYPDVRYLTFAAGLSGLADQERRGQPEVQDAVRMAVARIYNRMAREVTGEFVWIVEDDVIPPLDTAERLLRGFDEQTASVAAPVPSRYHEGYIAWTEGHQIIKERPESSPELREAVRRHPVQGYALVEGNGFGCVMLRRSVLADAVFTCRQQPYVDFDPAFYERLKETKLQAKLCWAAECRHLESRPEPIMLPNHWPEAWEELDLSVYRGEFLTGCEATQWIVDTLNGPEPVAIWGLSDGDVAWWCYDALARLPEIDRSWLDKLALTSGLHPEDRDELWPLFDQACRNAPYWLVQYNWEIAERFTLQALLAHGVTIDAEGFGYARGRKRKVDCNAVYRLLDHGLWWKLLEGKRLAIVSGRADQVAARLLDEEFVRATGGERVNWSVEANVLCPDVNVPKRQHWARMRDDLERAKWDLLLCSAGSLSAVLCDHARQSGRKGLDIGALDARTLQDDCENSQGQAARE